MKLPLALLALTASVTAFSVVPVSRNSGASSTQLRDVNLIADAAAGGLQIPNDSLPAVIGGAVAALGGAAAALTKGRSGSASNTAVEEEEEEEVEPIDVSIPYNAAALLAYSEFREIDKNDDAEYQKFQELWLGVQVAEATLKKKQREFSAAFK